MVELKERIKGQLFNYRGILRQTDVVEEIKVTTGIEKNIGKSYVNKENSRKWHSRLY